MNYEIGYKARLLGGRLLIDVDVLYMDYEDIQQSDQDGAGFFISNAAHARSYGLEVQTQWRLASSTFLNVVVGSDRNSTRLTSRNSCPTSMPSSACQKKTI